MNRRLVLAPRPDEGALRERMRELVLGRAEGASSIRIRKARAGRSKSMSFSGNSIGTHGGRRELTLRVRGAVEDLLAAPMVDEATAEGIRSMSSAAWNDLSHVLGALRPEAVDDAIAYPGSPWQPAWCISGHDGSEILSPAVVAAVFAGVDHLANITDVIGEGSLIAGFEGPLRFEEEDLDVVRTMRLLDGLRRAGLL